MLTSTRRGISYPNPDRSDWPDIPAHIGNLITALELDAIYAQGTDATRLARSHLAGVLFYATDTGVFWWDTGSAWVQILARPTVGGSFPASPVDGDEYVFSADAANGVYWRFVYRAATSKWIFVGGQPLYAEVATDESTSSTSYAALTTAGPSIALPFAGDYLVEIGCSIWNTSAAHFALMSYDIGATGAVDADGVAVNMPNVGSAPGNTVARARRKTGLTAVTLTAKYRVGANASNFYGRWMAVTPIQR